MEFPLAIISLAILMFSIILHELAHGYVALYFGDPTARLANRLTLNPLPHIDPLGSVILPALLVLSQSGFVFGWAKPVPYNPYNLRNRRIAEPLVAAAGSLVNLSIALIFGFIIRFGYDLLSPAMIEIMSFIVLINVVLALFNMIPIPPLDGSKVLSAFLPHGLYTRYMQLQGFIERYGLIATFGFIFLFIYLFSGPFFALIMWVFQLITGVAVF